MSWYRLHYKNRLQTLPLIPRDMPVSTSTLNVLAQKLLCSIFLSPYYFKFPFLTQRMGGGGGAAVEADRQAPIVSLLPEQLHKLVS